LRTTAGVLHFIKKKTRKKAQAKSKRQCSGLNHLASELILVTGNRTRNHANLNEPVESTIPSSTEPLTFPEDGTDGIWCLTFCSSTSKSSLCILCRSASSLMLPTLREIPSGINKKIYCTK
jgi:hypothetical protein